MDVELLVSENYQESWTSKEGMHSRYRDAAVKQVELYCRNFSTHFKDFHFISAEEQFDLAVADTLLTGRFDLVAEIAGRLCIIDYKTGEPGDYVSQVSLYALCYGAKHGVQPDALGVYYFKTGKLEYLSRASDSVILHDVLSTRDKIQKGEYGAIPGSQCADCSFRNICSEAV